MSVNTMALVFSAEMIDLPYEKDGEKHNSKASTVKLLLLAYADHANDNGRGAYPGYTKLEIKTALSRQGISDTLEAITQNGFMIFEGVSELGTNSYQINLDKLKELVKPLDSSKSSHLTGKSQAARLKPSFNPPQPSINDNDEISKRLSILSTLYESNIGILTPMTADLLRNDAVDYPEEWYKPAFEIAIKNNARNLKYIETILKSWKDHGFGWKPEAVKKYEKKKSETPAGKQLSDQDLERLRKKAEKEFSQ